MIRVQVEIGFSFKRELPDDYRELVLPDGAEVGDALRALADRFPTIASRLFTERGEARRDVGVLINGGNAIRRDGAPHDASRTPTGSRFSLPSAVGEHPSLGGVSLLAVPPICGLHATAERSEAE